MKRTRTAITSDRLMSIAQRYRRNANADIRALAMSVIRQRESAAKRERRAARAR